jgi:uncharacterized protein (TIGR02145 family)
MKTKVYFFALMVMSAFGLQAQTIMNIHQSNGTVLQIPLNTIDSITYTIPNPGNLATITTTAATSITGSTAVSGGNVSNDGGTLVTQRGICYSTSPSPTTANTTIISGSGVGSFTSNFTGLTASTTYYVRAYATNSAGTAYGNEVSFSTSVGIVSNPGTGVTFDGYTYASVILGNGQEWTAENLKTTVYANGDPIPNITDNAQWQALTTGAWANYDNTPLNAIQYGKLYNWYAINDSRNVCPSGWHVPTNSEWNILIGYLDPNFLSGTTNGVQSLLAGGSMKSTGTAYPSWNSPNYGATNESGFSGLPGSYRNADGTSPNNIGYGIGGWGYFWSSTNNSSLTASARSLHSGNSYVYVHQDEKRRGMSVRCLRD